MNAFEILLLGVVQGLTEFLPISSSGHLVIIEALLNGNESPPDGLLVNVVLHAGTLAAILVVYWNRIWRLLGQDRRGIGLLIVGTLPAVAAGLPLKLFFPELLASPLLAGLMLIATGTMLLAATGLPVGETDYQHMRYRDALRIGCFQAVAIVPGISRSGATIVAGLMSGLRRDAAATFSFLLAIPVIGGATILEVADLAVAGGNSTSVALLAIGAVASFGVGYLALRWLLIWLRHGRLHYFAFWCIPIGLAVAIWQIIAPLSTG